MRLFDEIKDYALDVVINPMRPLPRKLLSVSNVKFVILLSIIMELIIAATFGWFSLLIYLIPLFYSILMYEEFFISDFLRPKLTTYAVSHTIVVTLMSLSMMAMCKGNLIFLELELILPYVLSHWFIFNLFEFARKTFNAEEERAQVDSYSKIFTLKGAYGLSLTQVVLSLVMLYYSLELKSWYIMMSAALIYFVLILLFLLNVFNHAKHFRTISTIFLATYYILLVGVLCL